VFVLGLLLVLTLAVGQAQEKSPDQTAGPPVDSPQAVMDSTASGEAGEPKTDSSEIKPAATSSASAATSAAELESQIEAIQQAQNELSDQLSTAQKAQTALENRLQTAEEARTELENRLQKAETARTDLDTQLTALQQEKAAWSEERDQLQTTLESSQDKLKLARQALADLEQEQSTLKASVAQLTADLEKAKTRAHTVGKGESLSEIAIRYYGDGKRWNEIYAANKEIITNPDLLEAGMVLRIP